MSLRGLYSDSTWNTGHPAVHVPQAKHFLMFAPPGLPEISAANPASIFSISIRFIPVPYAAPGRGQSPAPFTISMTFSSHSMAMM